MLLMILFPKQDMFMEKDKLHKCYKNKKAHILLFKAIRQ